MTDNSASILPSNRARSPLTNWHCMFARVKFAQREVNDPFLHRVLDAFDPERQERLSANLVVTGFYHELSPSCLVGEFSRLGAFAPFLRTYRIFDHLQLGEVAEPIRLLGTYDGARLKPKS